MNFDQVPAHPIRADSSCRFAFVTFLMANDSYLPGALLVAQSLRRQQVVADLICLITEQISARAAEALALLYDRVIPVEAIYVPHKEIQRRQATPYMFTRIHVLRLGKDGDLGAAYDKVVVLDSDVLPISHYQHLFTLATPAGIINEDKYHFIEVDERNRYVVPSDLQATGKWCWHRIYDPICPHSSKIPSYITDRVGTDPSNLGINGSLFIMEPSYSEYQAIRKDLQSPATRRLVGDTFTWPDMQYLTLRWSGRWHNVDLRFSAHNGYPSLGVLFGTHFAGVKPWYFRRGQTVAHYARFPDYRLWYAGWLQLVQEEVPALQRFKPLRWLTHQIEALNLT